MNIALFGTSADPPTVGHQQILVGLASQFDRVVVWASDNPFKHHGATLTDRSRMLALVVEEANAWLGYSSLVVEAPIQLCPELSHRQTIVTVEQAQVRWPEADFTLVIGSDLVAQLPRWYRAPDLLHQVQVLVIPRPDFPVTPADLTELQHRGTQATIAQWQGLPVSSTAFREAGSTTSITPQVYHFIRQHHLYPSIDPSSFYGDCPDRFVQEALCPHNVPAS